MKELLTCLIPVCHFETKKLVDIPLRQCQTLKKMRIEGLRIKCVSRNHTCYAGDTWEVFDYENLKKNIVNLGWFSVEISCHLNLSLQLASFLTTGLVRNISSIDGVLFAQIALELLGTVCFAHMKRKFYLG